MSKSSKVKPVIPCSRTPEAMARVEAYAEELLIAAPGIGSHGLLPEEFEAAGLLQSAIERLRGRRAATMDVKKAFILRVLERLQEVGRIESSAFTGSGNRHDYTARLPGGRTAIIEAKGCLDGNNTTIYQRPANADEFLIWSLCQNPGADPRHNVWSGIHTRLGAKIVAERERIEALIVWDMLCGSAARPCPKLIAGNRGRVLHGKTLPPPCIYLFPRTVPDPRDNPEPPVWQLSELPFLLALAEEFDCPPQETVEVHIQARSKGTDVERQTTLVRAGITLHQSNWTKLRRASRTGF